MSRRPAPRGPCGAPRTTTTVGRNGRSRRRGRRPPAAARRGSRGWPVPRPMVGPCRRARSARPRRRSTASAATRGSMSRRNPSTRRGPGSPDPPAARARSGVGAVRRRQVHRRDRVRTRTRRRALRPAAPPACAGRRRRWDGPARRPPRELRRTSRRRRNAPSACHRACRGSACSCTSFTGSGGRSSGSGPSWSSVSTSRLPHSRQLRRRVPIGVGGQLGFGTRPDRGRQPLRGRASQHSRDHLDVPQTRCSRGELLRRRGQPRGQGGSIQTGAGTYLLRCAYPAPRLGAIPAHQICDGRDRVVIPPLGERAPTQQICDHSDDDLIQPSRRPFGDHESGEQIVRIGGRTTRDGKLVDGPGQALMRRDDRGAAHPSILPEHVF